MNWVSYFGYFSMCHSIAILVINEPSLRKINLGLHRISSAHYVMRSSAVYVCGCSVVLLAEMMLLILHHRGHHICDYCFCQKCVSDPCLLNIEHSI